MLWNPWCRLSWFACRCFITQPANIIRANKCKVCSLFIYCFLLVCLLFHLLFSSVGKNLKTLGDIINNFFSRTDHHS